MIANLNDSVKDVIQHMVKNATKVNDYYVWRGSVTKLISAKKLKGVKASDIAAVGISREGAGDNTFWLIPESVYNKLRE